MTQQTLWYNVYNVLDTSNPNKKLKYRHIVSKKKIISNNNNTTILSTSLITTPNNNKIH